MPQGDVSAAAGAMGRSWDAPELQEPQDAPGTLLDAVSAAARAIGRSRDATGTLPVVFLLLQKPQDAPRLLTWAALLDTVSDAAGTTRRSSRHLIIRGEPVT